MSEYAFTEEAAPTTDSTTIDDSTRTADLEDVIAEISAFMDSELDMWERKKYMLNKTLRVMLNHHEQVVERIVTEAEKRWTTAKRKRHREERDEERDAKRQRSEIMPLLERGIKALEDWKCVTERWIGALEIKAEEQEVARAVKGEGEEE